MTHDRVHLQHAALWDGSGTGMRQDQTVVLFGDRIEWVGPSASAPPVAVDEKVHDLSGLSLLPGMIDCHVHFYAMAENNPAARLHEPPALIQFKAVANMTATLDAGVTSVRDLSGIDFAAALAVERGYVRGPRILPAVTALGPTAGHSDPRTLSVPFGSYAQHGVPTPLADTVAEARKLTRELIRVGAGVIKVMASGGVWSPRDSPEDVGMGVAEMRAVVEEAGNRGILVAAHAQGAEGIKNALRAGVKTIEHGYLIDDEGIQMMLDRDAWLVPTLLTGTTPPDPSKATPYAVRKKNRVREQLGHHVPRAIAAGVKVGLGTDSGVVPHGVNLREIGLMIDHGLSPERALLAGTVEAARILGREDDLGSVDVGKVADLIVTDIDPLREAHGLGDPTSVRMVFQSGRLQKNTVSPTKE